MTDYLLRKRYLNPLPPPPIPPKLLNIPNTGLGDGHYTSAAFASRLAREQPLNIEADAELGMPINLIGLPGVFEGDESALYALEQAPAPHPHDRPLLRPLSMLGKPSAMTSGVSFLRRTEYISSDQGRSRFESTTSKDLVKLRQDPRKRKRAELERMDDPMKMVRGITKGFDIAYPDDAYTGPDSESNAKGLEATGEERTAWNKPRHPTNSELTLLDTYPVLPDLDAIPDSGSFLVTKFMTNPVAPSDTYDSRLDVAFLRPLELAPQITAKIEAQRTAHEADPSQPAPGPPEFDYEFFLPQDPQSTPSIRKMFNPMDPDKDNVLLYDAENKENDKRFFRYSRIRAYETYQQVGDTEDAFGDSVAMSLYDPPDDGTSLANGDSDALRAEKAAYIYPVIQRTFIRPRRDRNVAPMGMVGVPRNENENKVDFLEVVVRDADEHESERRSSHRARYENVTTAGT